VSLKLDLLVEDDSNIRFLCNEMEMPWNEADAVRFRDPEIVCRKWENPPKNDRGLRAYGKKKTKPDTSWIPTGKDKHLTVTFSEDCLKGGTDLLCSGANLLEKAFFSSSPAGLFICNFGM